VKGMLLEGNHVSRSGNIQIDTSVKNEVVVR
jgi:hypothetical protein